MLATVTALQRLSCDMTANISAKDIDLDKQLTPAIETRYARRLSVITGRQYPLLPSVSAPARSGSSGSLQDVPRGSAESPPPAGLVIVEEEPGE